ncbi:calcium-binding protein [Rhizobium sp. BE258]|uniref:calcium-binding protein n=1 Tax=Rhizobium sp. BE258 TaxID=2817722 RepID=UPI0028551B5D|nr:calcium-binding protein [Rhizobium sp. BE258]MDR7144284.1 hypothetical protein [Rhizobium sp. BE258]
MTNTNGVTTGFSLLWRAPDRVPQPPDFDKMHSAAKGAPRGKAADETQITSADLRNAADRWQATAIRILIGGATDDSISAAANSVVDAGAGDDTVTVGEKSFVDGGAGDDTIGAWSDSVIYGGEGNDDIKAWSETHIEGGAGNDVIDAWSDNYVDGGTGDDTIVVHSGSVVIGGKGNDTIGIGTDSTVRFAAGDGQDNIWTLRDGRIEFGEGLNADKMRVEHKDGKTIISFDGHPDDSVTINGFYRTFAVSFADGSSQQIERPVDHEAQAALIARFNANKDKPIPPFATR